MKRGRRAPKAAATLLCFFLFLYSSVVISSSTTTCFGTRRSSRADKYSQESAWSDVGPRRRLVGPGSYPPRCRGKCGTCVPCRPVHVAVPPGAAFVAEYYPEAWRCKCGIRLYIP